MKRYSSVEALGHPSLVHVLEVELSSDVLGGARVGDPFDSERGREAGNLLKRVCSKQLVLSNYAVAAIRDGAVRVRCGFVDRAERDHIADLASAKHQPTATWASLKSFVLDMPTEEALNAAGIPRDNRGPGRRAREKALKDQEREVRRDGADE